MVLGYSGQPKEEAHTWVIQLFAPELGVLVHVALEADSIEEIPARKRTEN